MKVPGRCPFQAQHIRDGVRYSHGREHSDGQTAEPAHRERERSRGFRVQPLHVVHRDDDRRLLGKLDEERTERDTRGLRVGRWSRGSPTLEQRDLQRLSLRI